MLLFALFAQRSLSMSIVVKEEELPYCNQTLEINGFATGIMSKKILAGTSFCISVSAKNKTLGVEGKSFLAIFRNLNGVSPTMYLRLNESMFSATTTEVAAYVSFAGKTGFLYFYTKVEKIISFSYVMFTSDCKRAFVSTEPRDEVNMREASSMAQLTCYFNGLPGVRYISASNNNEDVYFSIFPYFNYSYDVPSFNLQQNSAFLIKYVLSNAKPDAIGVLKKYSSSSRSRSKYTPKNKMYYNTYGDTESPYIRAALDPFSDNGGMFYGQTNTKLSHSLVKIIVGGVFGGIGGLFLFGLMISMATLFCQEVYEKKEKSDCTRPFDKGPIKDYSYSDD